VFGALSGGASIGFTIKYYRDKKKQEDEDDEEDEEKGKVQKKE
jgi:hypothetical protein